MYTAASQHWLLFSAVAGHNWPNINCGFAQCQDSPDNVKTRRGYWKRKLAGKILPKADWCEVAGSETLPTSKWEQREGKSGSRFHMMPNKLCVVEACFQQQHREFKIWQFYMTGVLVTRTNIAFYMGSVNTAAAEHCEDSQLQLEPPYGSACVYTRLSCSF